MNQLLEGIITKSYENLQREKVISFSIPFTGTGKLDRTISLIKRSFQKTFLNDFYKVFTSKIE